ncbi:MAG: hypothetical protein U5K76_09960 [Woeseiaceae bacterium]|nr:hypothetical protein [Woeseiaceae bacterium]
MADEIETILKDPAAAFSDPCEVLCQVRLSRDDKAQVLRQWRYDLVQLQVASEENLIGDAGGAALIRKIDECLRQLRAYR